MLSDEKLKEIMLKVEKIQATGSTDDEELLCFIDAWYDNSAIIERFMALSIDIWKEAAYRWKDIV